MTRRERRKQERTVRKKITELVCMWCAEPAANCANISGANANCPTCNDATKLIYKHHQTKLSDGYETQQ